MIEQCDREARNALLKLIDCMGGEEDCWQIDRAFAACRIAERERCKSIAVGFIHKPERDGCDSSRNATAHLIALRIAPPTPNQTGDTHDAG